jgi:hypothetical protein
VRRLTKVISLAIAAFAASAAVPASAATEFDFQFDNAGILNDEGLMTHDGPLEPPIVGTGTFTSPTDLGPGTYDLTTLSGFTVTFSFTNGDTFTTSDILTPLTGVAVQIVDLGGGVERLFFTESGGPGSDGGPNSGSLDLNNGTSFLSFSPSSFANFLYVESSFSGRYHALGSDVPEPSTWAMMLLGFGAIGFRVRRARAKAALAG